VKVRYITNGVWVIPQWSRWGICWENLLIQTGAETMGAAMFRTREEAEGWVERVYGAQGWRLT
jgi:hypothetical protein